MQFGRNLCILWYSTKKSQNLSRFSFGIINNFNLNEDFKTFLSCIAIIIFNNKFNHKLLFQKIGECTRRSRRRRSRHQPAHPAIHLRRAMVLGSTGTNVETSKTSGRKRKILLQDRRVVQERGRCHQNRHQVSQGRL